ncbi:MULTISPECIES: MetQ/NlpA family ABC transporter substrate-binding protein [Pseudomonas]|uniref:MetQ/NlpA family ABC transporter substrate-binding protein n=1 Tax=Pseudomonas guariconensis TaxID=1288410 RepID=UPI002097ABF4|nr:MULTISPECIES: MetQ/NlpA family ABC transporter substrate-binding protein [Pseudomonas]MCO7593467.1 MetQ/NlpA family ABC transporter substrate-binding protein [Pseudomonas guariconensis]MCU7219097.1 MetQ/NlpA family ABC transporter substrate-binding protein [Pseudomonas brassicacearum]
MLEKLFRPVAAAVLSLGLAATALADEPLKVGTTAAFAIPLEAAVDEARKQGLEVKLIEFSDWIAPNVSLASGDIDVNYFQHIPFLENAKAAAGFELEPYAPGIINNVGLYSKRYKRFADLPNGASVAIANDPINSGRGLQLLAKAGLIDLKPGVGYKATEDDIVANPKQLKILQVEAVQLVRAYDDADLVQGYPAYIRLANSFDATSALLFDGLENKEYVIQFVIRPQSKDDPRLARFVDIYQHSPAVRAALDKAHGSLYQAGWEG